MQKKIIISKLTLFIILFSVVIVYFNLNEIFLSIENFLNKVIVLKEKDIYFFLLLIILVNFLLFLTPIPTFLLIIFNGYVLNNHGFILSYILVITCSIILFNLIKKNKLLLNLKYFKKLKKKINMKKNFDINFSIIIISRYVLPYFAHNIFFGSIVKKTKIFLISISIAEIPIVYILNRVGISLKDFNNLNNINLNKYFDLNFITTMFFVIILILITNRSIKYIMKIK